MTPEKAKELLDNATPAPWETNAKGRAFAGEVGEGDTDLYGCGKIAAWGGYELLVISDEVPEDDREPLEKFIAASPEIAKAYIAQAEEMERLKGELAVKSIATHNEEGVEQLKEENSHLKAFIKKIHDFTSDKSCMTLEDNHIELMRIIKHTPKQSLTAIENRCYERAAAICDEVINTYSAIQIRKLIKKDE